MVGSNEKQSYHFGPLNRQAEPAYAERHLMHLAVSEKGEGGGGCTQCHACNDPWLRAKTPASLGETGVLVTGYAVGVSPPSLSRGGRRDLFVFEKLLKIPSNPLSKSHFLFFGRHSGTSFRLAIVNLSNNWR